MPIQEFFGQIDFSVPSILLCIFFGCVLAMGALLYNKYVPGKLVKYLIDNKIHTPEGAVTLEEAGLFHSALLRFSLRDGSVLRKTVLAVCAEGEKTDPRTAKFYLPEEKCAKARRAYYKNGTSVFTVILAIVLLFAAVSIVAFFLPEITELAKGAWPF